MKMKAKEWLEKYGKYNLDISMGEWHSKDPERIAALKEEKKALEMAIELLPIEDKTIIIRHYIEKKSYDKVARELGYAKSTIFEKTKKIVKTLEELLNT